MCLIVDTQYQPFLCFNFNDLSISKIFLINNDDDDDDQDDNYELIGMINDST